MVTLKDDGCLQSPCHALRVAGRNRNCVDLIHINCAELTKINSRGRRSTILAGAAPSGIEAGTQEPAANSNTCTQR
jgi:hypothetical protein